MDTSQGQVVVVSRLVLGITRAAICVAGVINLLMMCP